MIVRQTPWIPVFSISLCLLVLVSMGSGCNRKKQEKEAVTPPPVAYKVDTAAPADADKRVKPPVINITDTISEKRMVLVMKDSAASSELIGAKMFNIYNKILPDIIKAQNLKTTGPRIAWYKTSSAPFFFEAGLPVNKKPGKLPKNVYIKNIAADSAVVAHFYGPYSLTFQAYKALDEWMKSYKKRSAGRPYEIYINEMYDSTGKAVDPYRVRTDIVFPHK